MKSDGELERESDAKKYVYRRPLINEDKRDSNLGGKITLIKD
jgi:hypothetical protein